MKDFHEHITFGLVILDRRNLISIQAILDLLFSKEKVIAQKSKDTLFDKELRFPHNH